MTTLPIITAIVVALITSLIGPIVFEWVKLKFLNRKKIDTLIESIDIDEKIDHQLEILMEELIVFEETKTLTKCIYNKIDLVLVNLVPFINYPFNVGSIFILKNEIKHLIKYILVNNKKDYKKISNCSYCKRGADLVSIFCHQNSLDRSLANIHRVFLLLPNFFADDR